MNLTAEIRVKEDFHNIEKLFVAEEKEFKNKRVSYEIKKSMNELVFKVNAKDSSALRAVLNSITKLISVYEQTRRVVKK